MKGIKIDLLAYQDRIKIFEKDNERFLFDPVRKSNYKVLPEELVRQCWIQFLIHEHSVALASISVEKQIDRGTNSKRSDMVIYSKGKANVLFEFKSFKVKINEQTCRQVAVYNMKLKVPFIIISNGIHHYAYKIDFEEKIVSPLDQLPKMDIIR